MKQFLMMLFIVFMSCNGQQTAEQHEHSTSSNKEDNVVTVPLNHGAKWKADEATKKNVAALEQIVNDSIYADSGSRKQLYTNLTDKVNILVKECSMKGADHDALHVWLEKVLKDLKDLNADDHHYNEAYATLKKDIASFYQSFE